MGKVILVFASLMFFSCIDKSVAQCSDLKHIKNLCDESYSVMSPNSEHSIPLIALSSSQYGDRGSSVSGTYVNAILKAGGLPVIIPLMTDAKTVRILLENVDGLIMTGGEDIRPHLYNEYPIEQIGAVDSIRDVYDLMLIQLASNRNMPILGICRGEQLMNVAFGGSLYQDIPTQHPSSVKHLQSAPKSSGTHSIDVLSSSLLSNIIGRDSQIVVNSFHHQSVKGLASGFKVGAYASDGIVESIETTDGRPMLAVQWHPEAMVDGGDTIMGKIFQYLITQAGYYRKARSIHQRILSVDTHCDTPLWFRRSNFNMGKRDTNQINIPKMKEGYLDAIFFAAFISQGNRDVESSEKAVSAVTNLINGIYKQVNMNTEVCGISRTAKEAQLLKEDGKKAIFIGIENGYGIGKDLKNLSLFKSMGVTYMTLCHTKNNDICDTSNRKIEKEWGGLSPFGSQVVKEMNRLGILIDISHASDSTFWDVIHTSKQPVVATHSATRTLCNHDRNLSDLQLKALADKGGVIQVCPFASYINVSKDKATFNQYIDHIEHAIKIAGIDHVGIGSDFDGGAGIARINGANDMINITIALLQRGYNEDDIEKIWGKNFFRVLDQVQAAYDSQRSNRIKSSKIQKAHHLSY